MTAGEGEMLYILSCFIAEGSHRVVMGPPFIPLRDHNQAPSIRSRCLFTCLELRYRCSCIARMQHWNLRTPTMDWYVKMKVTAPDTKEEIYIGSIGQTPV